MLHFSRITPSQFSFSVSPGDPEKRYTAMSVTYQGQEVLELITDSEGEY
jgi:hypothetical protein